ncbi:MAG TPA: amidohydrolase family protein, partial [Roseateles sp.]|nr:amidohydrolase family protein [Roseateles sp.]
LTEDGFPVRVLSHCGWSHSLALDGADAVRRSYRQTPPDWPWIIHAAEGTDAQAAAEFEQLEALGCLRANTLLVHGLALGAAQRRRLVQAGAGLVWCPGSNLHLFGRTLDIHDLFAHRRLALGSDSRISGERDLLAELHLARELSGLDEPGLEALVTERAAELLRLPDRGVLEPGALADLLVLPQGLPLSRASRADIRLVMVGGRPRYADPDLARAFGDTADLLPVQVDGRPKCLARPLVAALCASPLDEPGLRAA